MLFKDLQSRTSFLRSDKEEKQNWETTLQAIRQELRMQTHAICNTSSFLFLVVRPGATRSLLAPSSDALCY